MLIDTCINNHWANPINLLVKSAHAKEVNRMKIPKQIYTILRSFFLKDNFYVVNCLMQWVTVHNLHMNTMVGKNEQKIWYINIHVV